MEIETREDQEPDPATDSRQSRSRMCSEAELWIAGG